MRRALNFLRESEQVSKVVTKVIRLEDFNPSSSGSYTTMSLAGSLFRLTSLIRTWRRDDDDIHGGEDGDDDGVDAGGDGDDRDE